MSSILDNFEIFCQTPGINSGKANSYSKAIKYLCDFLDITTINGEVISKLEHIQPLLNSPQSKFYKDLYEFLNTRHQSSYLTKGFIRAALRMFLEFWYTEN